MLKRILSLAVAVALIVTGIQITPTNSLETNAAETGWTLVWSDEFNGTSLDRSVWNYDIGTGEWGWGNGEVQYYTDKADNVSVSDGSLKITAKRENYNGSAYTSGRINTLGKKAFKYGKMEARIKVEGGNQNGVWPAFWMMGNNMASGTGWPYCGELDIMEHANSRNYVEGTLHWNQGGMNAGLNHVFWGSYSGGQYYYFPDNANNGINGWHTYGVIWDEQKIQWYVDDNVYLTGYITNDNAYAFQKEQFFLLNLALGGPQSPYTGNTTVDGSFSSATMYVDYVRAYQAGGSGGVTVPTNPVDPGDGLTATSSQKTNLGGWGYYLLGGNSGRYSGGTSLSEPFTLKIVSNNKAAWYTQAFTKEMDVTPGHTYKCSVEINSDAASGAILMKDEVSGTELVTKGLNPGNNVFEGTCKASDNGKIQLMFNLTEVNTGTTLKFNNVKLTDITSGEKETTRATQPQTTQPQVPGPQPTDPQPTQPSGAAEWVELGGDTPNTYYYDKSTMKLNEIVNIQHPGWADEKGIYMNVTSGISEVTVNGVSSNVAKIEGAGVLVYLSALTKEINEVKIKHGTGEGYVKIKNASKSTGEQPNPTTTAKAETKPAEPGTTAGNVKEPTEVSGAAVQKQEKGKVVITWNQTSEQIKSGQLYNVYIDGKLYKSAVEAQAVEYTFAEAGTYQIKITGVLGNRETKGVTLSVTVENVSETKPSEMTFEEIAGANQDITKGNYGMWINQTNTMAIAVDPADAGHIQGKILSNQNNWDQWAVQYKIRKTGLKAGEEYTVLVDMKASSDDGVLATDGDKQSVDLKESTSATLTRKAKADKDGNIVFTIGAGQVGIGVVLDFSNVVVKDAQGNVVGDVPTPETTPAVVETTPSTVETTPSTVETTPSTVETTPSTVETTPSTVETTPPTVETTPAVVETTTQTPVVTTEAPKTTVAPKTTTAAGKALGKTKVQSAAKKKTAAKVKIAFKKVKGAKKYQVQIAKNKKFKKVLVKKTVKKVKVTIKSRKLRKQKKLYVRVKAVSAMTWSKPKKIKIKK